MTIVRILRWTAIALAIVAVIDPRVPMPHRARPAVRILAGANSERDRALRDRLVSAGFTADGDAEVATVAAPDVAFRGLPATPLDVVFGTAPDVSIERAAMNGTRVAGQAVPIAITVRGRHVAGRTTELRLEDGGLPVATATHRWAGDDERWQASMTYLPGEAGTVRLRVAAQAASGEVELADNAADLLVAPQRAPIRTLVIAPTVTWPAVFVRRALEADPAFVVASMQHSTKSAVTRAGSVPATVTRADLEPYDVILSATFDLDATARDAVQWFVEERGGVAVFIPDHVPERAETVIPGLAFEPRLLEAPQPLTAASGDLAAAELAVPRNLPPLAQALASDASGAPMVFSARRGLGAVIVSGALDAWRYRDSHRFDEFWRTAILGEAITAPPRLGVSVTPGVARPGDRVRITARLRPTELRASGNEIALPAASARAVAPGLRLDQPVRLWPATEPGVYEGEWTAAAAGDYAIDVSIGALTAAAVLSVDRRAAMPPGRNEVLAVAARVSGGDVFADDAALIAGLTSRHPASTAWRPARPARTIWWAAAFSVLLSIEWALRRRRGQA